MITNSFLFSLLDKIGVQPTPARVNFLRAWSASENTAATNNPFATTWNMDVYGSTIFNSHGVRNYPDENIGLKATLKTLQQPNFKPIYNLIKSGLEFDTVYNSELEKNLNLWGTTGKLVKSKYNEFKNLPVPELKKKVIT